MAGHGGECVKVEGSGSLWSTLTRSSEGMKASGVGMAQAGGDVASQTQRVLSVDPTQTPDVIDARSSPDLQDSMMDLKRNGYSHLANGRVMQTADTLLESMLGIGDDREK